MREYILNAGVKFYRAGVSGSGDHGTAILSETDSKQLFRRSFALQVKYAYAITCHKAQGGQWSHVFVDLAYIPPEAMLAQAHTAD